MDKQQDELALISSDECPNSGEDSDEDVVTDYLGSEFTDSSPVSVVNGELGELIIDGNIVHNADYTKEMSEGGVELRNKNLPLLSLNMEDQQIPIVPTISVTPHSPGPSQYYPVLEDNLQQLHEIHNSIQRMRDSTLGSIRFDQNDHHQRLSSSCPSLNPQILMIPKVKLNNREPGSDVDLAESSPNSSPTHHPPANQRDHQVILEIDRRRSWTDLEKSRNNRHRCAAPTHSQTQNLRQRSISLSSLDSEMELDLDGKPRSPCASVTNCSCRSQTSTHSLNEADFVEIDLQEVAAKRGSQRLTETANYSPVLCVPGSRLPLIKSISTPSIVTPAEQTLTESEAQNAPSTTGAVYDDSHSEKTRRKRGSLFFRKRKDKSVKKTSQQTHHWVTVTAGSQGNFVCDYCMKQFGTKSVSHCENCGTTVHQNQSCKDQMPSECTKSKSSSNKGATKSMSSVSIASVSGHVKRGSTASLPPQSSIGSNSQTINEERDGDGSGQRDIISGTEEIDFVDDVHLITVDDIEGLDPELGLKWEEPDSWSASIGRSDALRLVDNNEKEVKRQEHIYEFVLTEKHHCLVLLAMEKIFAEGLRRHFRLGPPDLERMFPRLRDLIEIHLRFLLQLRKRQNASTVVPTIADILVDQFSGINASRMKSAYGEFCSRHRDAVDSYKCYLSNEPRFAKFVRLCQTNPLLKKKGIPECILFVTQRLTKYPLLVEPLIKTGTSNEEKENLRKALKLVKEILSEVDACVADKQREDRKLEIFSRIDAKSFAMHRGEKFKKSNILSFSRVLKFEGTANLMQGRGKPTPVVVVVLSDVLLFLAETRDQKYAFFVPDNRAGVVSLQKLLVREKAGQESRGIYLISSNPSEPEMFELKVLKPKDKQIWIQSIRSAVEACPQEFENDGNDDENSIGYSGDLTGSRSGYSSVSTTSTLTLDERQKNARAKESHILGLVGELRKKDTEQALLLEEKMALQMRLLYAASVCRENETEAEKTERIEKSEQSSREIPDYTRWVRNEGTDSAQLWQEVVVAVQEATRLASSLSFSAHCGGSLSRSLSSAGEKHSDDYVPLALAVPRRAETFAGFDHNKERYPWRDSAAISSVVPPPKSSDLLLRERSDRDERDDDGMDINKDQQLAAIRLSHYVYTLLCIITNQMTTIDSLQAQLATCRDFSSGGSYGGSISKSSSQNRPNPNRQLEELRNLQDQLSREKSAFRIASEQERMRLLEEKNEIARKREQLAAEQSDVKHQRDQLYRRLEALERQGVSLVAPSTAHPSIVTHSNQVLDSTLPSRKSLPDAKRIPLNLISATNQQKAPSNLPPVKQQLPLKLASGSNNNSTRNSSSSGINNSPDRHERHSRTGSSPAAVTTSAYWSPELGNSQNNGNSSHGSNRSLRITRSPPESYHHQQQQQQQQQTPPTQPTIHSQTTPTTSHQQPRSEPQHPFEEEVIFF